MSNPIEAVWKLLDSLDYKWTWGVGTKQQLWLSAAW